VTDLPDGAGASLMIYFVGTLRCDMAHVAGKRVQAKRV
jgi:hypothetical protein